METYLVGGAVRDQLLDYPVLERDWVVVGATPEQMLEQGYRQVGRDFPVYLHPETNEEYALARTERKSGGGHTGFVCNADPGVTLEEDLSRRDLTVNAIARADNGKLIDPYGGQADLEQRVLRHVSPAFVEDPLRVLRVARFLARYQHLGFSIDPTTLALMRNIAESGEIQLLPAERIWSELARALNERSPAAFFNSLQQCTALDIVMPELEDLEHSLARLQSASTVGAEDAALFAVLLAELEPDRVEALCKRLHAPRRFRELALLTSRCGSTFQRAQTLSAEELLEVLEQTDGLRRPERFEQFIASCELAWPGTEAKGNLLRRALQTCSEVDSREFASAGISGLELGRRIRDERLRRLAKPGSL
jgi:tRNA nucleotidyltransferase (CCA-adding enzyme)